MKRIETTTVRNSGFDTFTTGCGVHLRSDDSFVEVLMKMGGDGWWYAGPDPSDGTKLYFQREVESEDQPTVRRFV